MASTAQIQDAINRARQQGYTDPEIQDFGRKTYGWSDADVQQYFPARTPLQQATHYAGLGLSQFVRGIPDVAALPGDINRFIGARMGTPGGVLPESIAQHMLTSEDIDKYYNYLGIPVVQPETAGEQLFAAGARGAGGMVPFAGYGALRGLAAPAFRLPAGQMLPRAFGVPPGAPTAALELGAPGVRAATTELTGAAGGVAAEATRQYAPELGPYAPLIAGGAVGGAIAGTREAIMGGPLRNLRGRIGIDIDPATGDYRPGYPTANSAGQEIQNELALNPRARNALDPQLANDLLNPNRMGDGNYVMGRLLNDPDAMSSIRRTMPEQADRATAAELALNPRTFLNRPPGVQSALVPNTTERNAVRSWLTTPAGPTPVSPHERLIAGGVVAEAAHAFGLDPTYSAALGVIGAVAPRAGLPTEWVGRVAGAIPPPVYPQVGGGMLTGLQSPQY